MSKASKRRQCPALGRDISAPDCGEQRQSRLACPAECPYNPFSPANYSELLEIENRLDEKTMDQLEVQAADPAALESDLITAHRRGIHGANAFFVWRLFFAQDAAGNTAAQRWVNAGSPGLKNDERVLLRGKMQMRVALLEAHRIFAGGRVEAVDLFSPQPEALVLQDRSLAGIAARFSTFLSWVYPLPHYWRLSGTAAVIPDVTNLSAPEIIREIARHLGGPSAGRELRRWLAENFLRVSDALAAVARVRRKQLLSGLDAKCGKAVYELRASFASCRDGLDQISDVEPGELSEEEESEGFAEARDWFDASPEIKALAATGGKVLLGRVLLGQSHWRLETFGAEKLSRLRRNFEGHFGERVRFCAERLDDLGARMISKEPAVDESLVPPRLLENPDRMMIASSRIPAPPPGVSLEEAGRELKRASDRGYLDEPIPGLENCTPRQAARNPALRPRLLAMMKQRVRDFDSRNLEKGSAQDEDINWMLRELELNEIIFDPPPWRPPPNLDDKVDPGAEFDGDIPGPGELDTPPAPDPNRPPAPPLPDEPLDFEESAKRWKNALGMFESAAEAENELYASGATLLEDAGEISMPPLTETDFCFTISFLLQAWFSLVPRGCRAPSVPFADLDAAFAASLHQLETCVKAATPKKMEEFFRSGPQPELLTLLTVACLEAAAKAPKEIRPSLDSQPIILALLKAVVEQLDRTLRRRAN